MKSPSKYENLWNSLPASQESAVDCVNKVKEVFKEIGVAVTDDVIDGAHWVGGELTDSNSGELKQAMIAKFLAWNHRTPFCGGR